MKKIMLLLPLVALIMGSCNKVDEPKIYDSLDKTIYPGTWEDYEANEWPTFTQNTNTNRNVMIEDFTGHKCIFCPAAASVAEQLEQDNPGRVFVASLHTGPDGIGDFQKLHEPLYTHQFYNNQAIEIGQFFGKNTVGSPFVGNPFGSVGRRPVNGYNTHSPSTWTGLTSTILAENDLKVNIQGKVNYYDETKGFFLHTEVDVIGSIANPLAQVVYFVEDSIVKPQAFPGGVDSINYVHHNVMRGCIDEMAFGKTLSDTYKGTNGKYYLNYSYRIPSQYNPENVHLLVFVIDKVTNEIYQVIELPIIE